MKPIQSSLKRWMTGNENFKANYEQMQDHVLNHPDIKKFLSQHQELTKKDIDKSLIKLYEYIAQSKNCDHCPSFETCQNMIQGYTPSLQVRNQEIHIIYEKCPCRLMYEKEKEQQKLIHSLYVPREILQASINEIDNDLNRSAALRTLLNFLEEAKKGLPQKGIYFSGPFGVGKTYFLGVLANELKKLQRSSMLVYMPEFNREIKSSLRDDSLNEKIDYFKKADVLMFDDIGAEMQSAWFRDEVLGSILQYRMMEKLPVFFTSNYSLSQLEEQLASTRDGIEKVKAGRIIERIKQVSSEVPVYGKNRRDG